MNLGRSFQLRPAMFVASRYSIIPYTWTDDVDYCFTNFCVATTALLRLM